MKKIIILIIAGLMCIMTACNEDKNQEAPSQTKPKTQEVKVVETQKPTLSVSILPEPTATPASKSLYDALPQPTPIYEPTEEDLEFKQQVISDGKTLAFDMTEWELIDIMCNILGKDEYLYRLKRSDNNPNELYLSWTRNEPEGLNYAIYILDTQNGDIFYRDEVNKEYIVGNIFTSEVKEEPFRLSEYNKKWLIEKFIDKAFKEYKPEEIEVQVAYDGMAELYFSVYKIIDGEKEFYQDYWFEEDTGRAKSYRFMEVWYIFN